MNTSFSEDDFSARAGDPGYVTLSIARLRTLYPKYFRRFLRKPVPGEGTLDDRIQRLEQHLGRGDSRAAIVVSVKPLLVAAFTDEIDCVAMLQFPSSVLSLVPLQVGSRLLTVNTYFNLGSTVSDLHPGRQDTGRYQNFHPVIADFFSEDEVRIAIRKQQISEEEWKHVTRLGSEYSQRYPDSVRDGCPFLSASPGSQEAVVKPSSPLSTAPTVKMTDAAVAIVLAWMADDQLASNQHSLLADATFEGPEHYQRSLTFVPNINPDELSKYFTYQFGDLQLVIPQASAHAFVDLMIGYDPERGGFHFRPINRV